MPKNQLLPSPARPDAALDVLQKVCFDDQRALLRDLLVLFPRVILCFSTLLLKLLCPISLLRLKAAAPSV